MGPEIEQLGFERISGPGISYRRDLGDRHQYIHLEYPAYLNVFTVALQENHAGRSTRAISLEEFVGLKDYAYGSGSAAEMETAAMLAKEHFRGYALPWLEGRTVDTPALQQRRARTDEHRYEDLVRSARESFKRHDYAGAIHAFREAESIRQLDSVSAKFRDIAAQKSAE